MNPLYFLSISNFIKTLALEIHNTFCRIGYLRASQELSRIGYHKEAKRCLEYMKDL